MRRNVGIAIAAPVAVLAVFVFWQNLPAMRRYLRIRRM